MQDENEGDYGISEETAKRRGMVYTTDARGRVTSARLPRPFLIDELLERGIIHPDAHYYGAQFLAMRKLFLSPVSGKAVMLRIQPSDGTPPPEFPIEDNDYLKVLRRMRHRAHQELVADVCNEELSPIVFYEFARLWTATDPTPAEADRRKRQAADVRAAFEAMQNAVIALWEQKKQAKEAEQKRRENEDRIKRQYGSSHSACANEPVMAE
jgi:hypothetical protein